jgi:hypothetical protein
MCSAPVVVGEVLVAAAWVRSECRQVEGSGRERPRVASNSVWQLETAQGPIEEVNLSVVNNYVSRACELRRDVNVIGGRR